MSAEIFVRSIGQTGRSIANRYTDAGLLLLTFILVISDTLTRSYFSIIFFGDASFGAFLMINYVVILIFAGMAALRRDLYILTIFLAITAFFVGYYLYYIYGTGRPLNFNPLGTYYGMLTVIVFYELARRRLLPAAMKMIFFVFVGYLAAYSALSLAIQLGVNVPLVSQKVTLDISDPDRAGRIAMFLVSAAYVAAYSVSRLKVKFSLGYLATCTLTAGAAYLSMSRLLIGSSLAILLLYLVMGRLRLIQRLSFIGYLLNAAYLVYGVLDSEFNPYWFGSSDMSTLARKYQFDIVVAYIRDFPFFGIGLPDATEGLTYYLGKVIFPSDLGIVGIWFQFGLFGVAVLGGFMIYISCLQNTERSSKFVGSLNASTLALTGCIIALGLANEIFIGSAPMFSLIFANTLHNARASAATERRPQPRRLSASRPPRIRST
jgi:hypothetical protein